MIMNMKEIHQYATSYKKIKSHQIIDGLYRHFTSWEKLPDFHATVQAPNGAQIELQADAALTLGIADFQGHEVAIIAQQTPPSEKARNSYNYGLVQADGYGLALCMMRYAEKYGLMLHTFIDTVGGDPFECSAAKLQSWLIAQCQAQMINLKTRSISTIIGQGGSGGAIALQLAHRRYMLKLSTYSVIAPDGCAAILFRKINDKTISSAIDMLQPTASFMLKYKIIDDIIFEPPLYDPCYIEKTLNSINIKLIEASRDLVEKKVEEIREELQEKIAECGRMTHAKPWYPHETCQDLRPRSVSLPRPSVSQTNDPHIAFIRRHAFGDADCTPKACNSVRDEDGNIIRQGCGTLFTREQFSNNWQMCPSCFRPDTLDPYTYIDLIFQNNSFYEIGKDLTVENILHSSSLYDYSYTRQKMENRGYGKEALVIGYGKIFDDLPVAVAISNFFYMGGSMGAIVGEKFFAISEFACKHKLPLVAVTATGGARMQEGTVALAQMAKTTAAVVALRREGLPYISILGHPTVGGVLASYATLADFIFAEHKATLSFAGDRVVKLTSGGRGVNAESMTSEFFAQHGGIHAVVKRHELKTMLAGVLRMTAWFKDDKLSDLTLAQTCQNSRYDYMTRP